MKAKRIVLIAVAISATAWAESPQTRPAEKEAIKVAQDWLVLLDAGQCDRSWEAGAQLMKRDLTKRQFCDPIGGVRKQAGKMLSRKLSDARHVSAPPGFPTGTYVSLKYETTFENREPSVEWITVTKEEDGVWRLLGYQLNFAPVSGNKSEPAPSKLVDSGDSAPAGATSKAPPAAASIEGHLSRVTIRRTIRNHLVEIRSCYEKRLLRRPEIAERTGRVTARFTVAGTVIVENTLGASDIETCILNRVGTWAFPKTKRGETVVVYPFVFKATGDEPDPLQ